AGEALVDAIVREHGAPHVLVNNAGTTHRNQSMLEVDEDTYDRVFAVNVKSIFHTTRAVVPLMRSRKDGVILNVGSVGGIRPRPGLTWYNSSKGAVKVMTKSMAVELANDGIRVNVIAPVMAATGLLQDFMGVADTPENRARFVSTIPLGRMCTPEDVANVAVFLASDAARFLTGIEMPVDGGRSI
ncbi:MAG: SDR family oxidoreductase, partial [Proteobacteria bacterium]|nr:SDR family oxidoreductase [Pseudomonadota bacterium]